MDVKKIKTLNVDNTQTIGRKMTGELAVVDKPQQGVERKRALSDREKISRALGQTQVDLYIDQEQKRAPRQQIDQPVTLKVLIVLTVASFIASAVLVAEGTALVAQYMILPKGWEGMGYLVFGSIEVAILALMLLYLLIRSRPDESDPSTPAKAGGWFALMCVFVGVTVVCQVFKTMSGWHFDWYEPKMWVGVLLSTIVPLSYVFISKGLSTAVFARPIFISAKKKVAK